MAMTADTSQTRRSDMSATNGIKTPSHKSPKHLPSSDFSRAQLLPADSESVTSPMTETTAAPADDDNHTNNSLPTDNSIACNGNAAWAKKAAWNKPSVAVNETASPVMGAATMWPALSESTKASPKSAESSKLASNGSLPSPQGVAMPHSPQTQAAANAKSHSTTNHTMPARPRPKRGGGGGGSGSGGGREQNNFNHPPPPPPPPPPYPVFPIPPNGFGNMMPGMPDHPPRDAPYRPLGGFVPQPRPVVNDHRHSSRRGNFGPRGDGPYPNSFGGDVHMQPQRGPPRGFVRAPPPPPNSAAFVAPQPMRPFANTMGFHDFLFFSTMPMDHFRGVPMVPHSPPPAVLMPVQEPPLPAMLMHQIEYYFSDANLIKDEFFKSNMDEHGWVPISLIAGFNRVKSMTNDIPLILESLKISTVLEVQDDKVRRRGDWMKWVPSSSRQSSSASSYEKLTNSVQKMSIEDVSGKRDSTIVESSEDAPRICSTELTMIQPQVSQCKSAEERSSG